MGTQQIVRIIPQVDDRYMTDRALLELYASPEPQLPHDATWQRGGSDLQWIVTDRLSHFAHHAPHKSCLFFFSTIRSISFAQAADSEA